MFDNNPVFQDLGSSFRIGQINRYYPAEDENNLSGTVPEYDVLMYDGMNGQVLLSNVRTLKDFSSLQQIQETILETNVKADERAEIPSNQNGALVVIGFIDSNFNKPFIIGAFEHEGTLDPIAIEEEGRFKYSEFNGLKQKVNDSGELEITFTGRLDEEGEPVVADQTPITFKLGIDGTVSSPTGHRFIINGAEDAQRVQIVTANNQIFQIEDTPDAEAITMLHKSGALLSMQTNGSVQLIGSNGGYLFINTEADELSLTHNQGHIIGITSDEINLSEKGGADIISIREGQIQLTSGGDVTLQASAFGVNAGGITFADQVGGSLKIENGLVALGGPTAELLDLFDQLLQQLDTLLTNVQTSTHIGNLGFPTAPPVEAGAYAPIQVQINLIKTLLGTIKGTL